MTIKIELTLTMEIEPLDGQPLTESDARKAYDDAAHAIQNRLFGEGFLPDHIGVIGWDVRHTGTVVGAATSQPTGG